MKLTLFALLAIFSFTGCTNTNVTHRNDFSAVDRKGPWNDYYQAVKHGEQPPTPKDQAKK